MNKHKILIVEDDAIIAADISGAVQELGYEVVGHASSGEQAIKKALTDNPELVLMDIVLKGAIDGIKAATHIMSQFNIPVVYLTSHSDKATLKRAKETGPLGYLLKPYSIDDMRATLEMAFYKHGMEKRLMESEQWLSIILNSIADAVIVTNASGLVEFMNPVAEGMTGCSADSAAGKQLRKVIRIMDEATRLEQPDIVEAVLSDGDDLDLSKHSLLVGKNDKEVSVNTTASTLSDDSGTVTGVVLVLHDATESRRTMKLVEKSERFLSSIFDSIFDPFCIYDSDYKIVRANDAYAALYDMTADKVQGEVCYKFLKSRDSQCEDCLAFATFKSGKPSSREKEVTIKDGTDVWVESFTYPIVDNDGTVTHVVEYSRNITQRREAEEERRRLIKELEVLSRVDGLTELLNRRALMEFIEQDIDRSKRYDRDMSVILCDIDNFKEINDTFGHHAGDIALKAVSQVLTVMARTSDVVGRYGGDEFLLVLPETPLAGAKDLAERIRIEIEKLSFMPTLKKKTSVTMSFGVSSLDLKRDSVDFFITRADSALYASKRQGRNRVSVMEP